MNKSYLVVHRALIEWIRTEKAVNVSCTQIGDHFGWRSDPNLNVPVRIQAAFSESHAKAMSPE